MNPLILSLLVAVASALSHQRFVPLGRHAAAPAPSQVEATQASSAESSQAFDADDDDDAGEWEEDSDDLAAMVPLNDMGYQEVAATHATEQLKAFVRRILASESRSVKDEAGLSGLVPYYKAEKGRKFWDLKHELREKKHSWWIEEGVARTAPLNEDGYRRVADLKDNKQMKAFMRRVVAANGMQVTSEGKFSGLVPFYSGKVMAQTYQRLLNEIRNGDWVSAKTGGAAGAGIPLSQAGYASLVKSCKAEDMKAYIVRLLESEARVVKDEAGLAKYAAGGCPHKDLEALKRDLRSFRCAKWVGDGPGRSSPLSEEGFQQVVGAQSNKQMKAFMRRIIADSGKVVHNEGDFSGMVQFYSGVGRNARSWKDLQAMVKSAAWLG